MQDQKNNVTLEQANNLFMLTASPLGLIGLARYKYQGDIGFLREVFIMYFAFGVLGWLGVLHLVHEVSPANYGFIANILKWALGFTVLCHVAIFLDEIRFFKVLRNSLNQSN